MADGSEQRMDRENSALFTHLGNLAMYDHVFVLTNEEASTGAYIFRHSPVFERLAAYMVSELFPQHLNRVDVAECDMQAFEAVLKQEVPDELPEDWN
jgi:hypothetical protein